jgi:ornithine cyclodeaminase
VDSREAASIEAGDLLVPISEGVAPSVDSYGELGELVSRAIGGRDSEQQITVFKSVGIAVMDLYTAQRVVQKAVAGATC